MGHHDAQVLSARLGPMPITFTTSAYGLFYTGLRSVPGSTAMIVTLLEPVTAIALAAVLLAEPLTASNVLGGALLLASVVALYLRPPAGLIPSAREW